MPYNADILIGTRPPEIGVIRLSLSQREEHILSSTVTRYPVEGGSPGSDHIQNEPDSLLLEGFVTDSPVGDLDRGGAGNGQTAYESLSAIHRSRELVRVFTTLREYQDMALEHLSVPKDAATGAALRFSAQFVHVKMVTSETVVSEDLSARAGDSGSSTREVGAQNTKEANAKQRRSMLKAILG